MLAPEQIAAIVTTPFFPISPQHVRYALDAVQELPIQRVYLLYDRKQPISGEQAQKAVSEVSETFATAGKKLVLHPVDAYETASRWRYGIVEALKTYDVQAVFVFPGDLGSRPEPHQVAGWQGLLEKAGPRSLVIGDYRSKDVFKATFDALIGVPAIRLLFPNELKPLVELGLAKMRSEFFCIGRQVFEHFERDQTFSWGMDPTIQVTLSCLRSRSVGLNVEDHRFGAFEEAGERHPLTQMAQIIRFALQLALDRIAADLADSKQYARAGEEERDRYNKLIPVLSKLFDKIKEALEERLF